jgi:hypothetical protein
MSLQIKNQTPKFTIAKRGSIQTVLTIWGLCCARPERRREDQMSVRKTVVLSQCLPAAPHSLPQLNVFTGVRAVSGLLSSCFCVSSVNGFRRGLQCLPLLPIPLPPLIKLESMTMFAFSKHVKMMVKLQQPPPAAATIAAESISAQR